MKEWPGVDIIKVGNRTTGTHYIFLFSFAFNFLKKNSIMFLV